MGLTDLQENFLLLANKRLNQGRYKKLSIIQNFFRGDLDLQRWRQDIMLPTNLVSRQFGVSQIVPKSFFSRNNELCLYTVEYSESEYLQRLDRHAADFAVLTPFPFHLTFYCTKEFDTWWRAYYAKEFLDVATLSQYLTYSFSSLHKKF